jgi:hypothetical protein
VPLVARRWAIDDSPTTEGTADERKEAIAPPGKELAPICERVSHSAVFQTGPKPGCDPAEEPPMGRSSFDLGHAPDGMERGG